MDIFAHTLWANAAAKEANEAAAKKGKKFHISPGWAAFWGVFPDFFAFGLPMLISAPVLFREGFHFGPHSHSDLAANLYQYSHSLVIWAAVFLIVWAIYRRPRWELLGWALHILIDIPSHGASFYPTPFLFPISDYRFLHGVSWANPIYMMINYSALSAVYLYYLLRKKKAKVMTT